MSARWALAVALLAALRVIQPASAAAQSGERPIADTTAIDGVLPDAGFGAMFRKYTAPQNVLSPFYSWDADMSLDLTIVRRGRGALRFSGMFQSAGTRNLGSKVGVGGTGYFLGLSYLHKRSDDVDLSAGLLHFSSHLTRDLDDTIDEERSRGNTIPPVEDPSEFNVFYFRGRWKLRRVRFVPELDLAIQPINFRFNGSKAQYVRPVYLGTVWTLWQGERRSLTAETQQEIGERAFFNVILLYALSGQTQPERRFQVFVSASPGGGVRVSPQIGALRNGVAVGIRLNLRA